MTRTLIASLNERLAHCLVEASTLALAGGMTAIITGLVTSWALSRFTSARIRL